MYFISMNADDPSDFYYILNWSNRLDIGDTNIFVIRNPEKNYKEVSLSFKNIFINTFNVIVLDLSPQSDGVEIMYRHESFQLWESKCESLLLNGSNEFILLNKTGIDVLLLGYEDKKLFQDVN